jgi:hypothetical protein
MSTTTNEAGAPRAAQLELLALVEAVQQVTAAVWANEDSPSPVGCQLTPETTGVAFTATRTSAEVLREGAVADVMALLIERGMEVGRRDAYGFISLLGVHPANRAFTLELRVFAQTAMIVAQSACAPGDVWDELQRVKRDLADAGSK